MFDFRHKQLSIPIILDTSLMKSKEQHKVLIKITNFIDKYRGSVFGLYKNRSKNLIRKGV